MSTCACCLRQIKIGKDGRIVLHGQKVAGKRTRCVPVGHECPGSFVLPAEDPASSNMLTKKLDAIAKAEGR